MCVSNKKTALLGAVLIRQGQSLTESWDKDSQLAHSCLFG